MAIQQAEKGDVIQMLSGEWEGVLLVVMSVKDWGVNLAWAAIPVGRETYYRAKHGEYAVIGRSMRIPSDDTPGAIIPAAHTGPQDHPLVQPI